jgi:hypothetical protein
MNEHKGNCGDIDQSNDRVAAATLAAAASLLELFLNSPEQTNRNTERFFYLAFAHLHFRI